jgi:hypothetical protein
MTSFKKKCGLLSATFIASFVSMQPLQAASSFNSSSEVSFTLMGIANLTNSGDLSNLDVSGAFSLDTSSSITSNSILLNYNSTSLANPVAAGDGFSQSFGVSGSVSNTNATAYFLAARDPQAALDPNLANLFLRNNSLTDVYQIDIALDYSLTANASGDFANTDISLDYYSLNTPAFSGFDYAYASAFLSPYGETISNSAFLSLILAPGEMDALFTDVTINGYIEASASPVPLPPAIWPFLTGLFTLMMRIKRRSETV